MANTMKAIVSIYQKYELIEIYLHKYSELRLVQRVVFMISIKNSEATPRKCAIQS